MAFMLTTVDNPYNPFTQFDQWETFDESQGYYTCNYLARIAHVSASLSTDEYDTEINTAIDEIIHINTLGIYLKVSDGKDQLPLEEVGGSPPKLAPLLNRRTPKNNSGGTFFKNNPLLMDGLNANR